jgi:hypothetical protein
MPELMMNEDPPYLEICFRSTFETISSTRRYVSALYQPLLEDRDQAERLGLATHEMLENTHKYSAGGDTLFLVRFSNPRPPCDIRIGTRNRIAPEARAALDEVFAQMAGTSDAMKHYQGAMKRAAVRRQGSGLGLARIWAEAEMEVTHSYDGDHVWIWAAMKTAGASR